MIFGVTVDGEGQPLKRMIVNRKLGVGLPPGNGKNYPQRFDHFISTVRTGSKGEFELDKEFTAMLGAKYGNPLMEVDVILLSNNREEIFKSEVAWRTQDRANALVCHGDGKDATRRVSGFTPQEKNALGIAARDPKEWIEIKCPLNACPHLISKECRPSGDLYFMFPEDPISGSAATLHTGGWEAVKRLAASLAKIESDILPYGGQLMGLRLKLVARWYRTEYVDKNGSQVGRQLAFNLEFRQADAKQLMPALINESRQLAMSIGEVIDVEPLPDEQIADEFHPTPEQQEEQRKAETTIVSETAKSSVLDRLVTENRPPVAHTVTAGVTGAVVGPDVL